MADKEFEEFRHAFEQLPQHIKAPSNCYRLALDISLELSPNHELEPPNLFPPIDDTKGGSDISPYWMMNNGLNNNTIIETSLTNKYSSSNNPPSRSENQISNNSAPDAFLNRNEIASSHSLPALPHVRSSALKDPPALEALASKLSTHKRELSENLNCEEKSRNRNTTFEVNDNRPNCPSPICGSPRPKAPIPKLELDESQLEELCRLESGRLDDELIISYIDKEYKDITLQQNIKNEELRREEQRDVTEEPRTHLLRVEKEPEVKKGTRRKLPEIPKNQKSFNPTSVPVHRTPTLAEEIQEAESGVGSRSSTPDEYYGLPSNSKSILVLKCHPYHRDNSCSPEADLPLPLQDFDSGHYTQHSPVGNKSPQAGQGTSLPWSLGLPISHVELLDATHRGLYRFIPRHEDEVEIEIGDPVYVQKEADDLWCEGVNLRSGKQGIFPSAHVTDVDYSDFDPTVPKAKKERYLLNYLGSIETLCHKGNEVLCQAVRKIARESAGRSLKSSSCILEISDQGIRMVDKSSTDSNKGHCHDYFYHLKHVSFCGFHPKDPRYFGFITKHPAVQRFACHVFESLDSTRPVAEAVGRAFQRFYKQFIETAYPTEDIYIE